MEIRQLRADEVEQFVDGLWLPAQHETITTTTHALVDEVRADGLAHRQSRLPEDDSITYVAEADRFLGFLSAAVQTPPPIFEQVRDCHVSELFVREAARRQGVGTALLAHAEEWADRQDCRKLDLNVHRDNPGAKALYEAAGYEVARYNMTKQVGTSR